MLLLLLWGYDWYAWMLVHLQAHYCLSIFEWVSPSMCCADCFARCQSQLMAYLTFALSGLISFSPGQDWIRVVAEMMMIWLCYQNQILQLSPRRSFCLLALRLGWWSFWTHLVLLAWQAWALAWSRSSWSPRWLSSTFSILIRSWLRGRCRLYCRRPFTSWWPTRERNSTKFRQ